MGEASEKSSSSDDRRPEIQERILLMLAEQNGQHIPLEAIRVDETFAHHVELLESDELIGVILGYMGPSRYGIVEAGRAYLVEHELVQ